MLGLCIDFLGAQHFVLRAPSFFTSGCLFAGKPAGLVGAAVSGRSPLTCVLAAASRSNKLRALWAWRSVVVRRFW
jgi:hypothetical protein